MSKPNSLSYWGTHGAIVNAIMSLTRDPDDLINNGFVETTTSSMALYSSSRMFYDALNNLYVRFDKGDSSFSGFREKDHYHVYNPSSTGKRDCYLDKNGKPCAKGSRRSHIIVY